MPSKMNHLFSHFEFLGENIRIGFLLGNFQFVSQVSDLGILHVESLSYKNMVSCLHFHN